MRLFPCSLAALLLATALSPALAADDTTKPYNDRHGFSLRVPLTASVETDTQENGQLDMIPDAAVVVSIDPDEFKGTNLGNGQRLHRHQQRPDHRRGVQRRAKRRKVKSRPAPRRSAASNSRASRSRMPASAIATRQQSIARPPAAIATSWSSSCIGRRSRISRPARSRNSTVPEVEAELHTIMRSFAITGRAL